MPFLLVLGFLVIAFIIYVPQWWVRWVMQKHSLDRPDLPGTGGELARHLLDSAHLENVVVEETVEGDHYDPLSKTVRLSKANFNGRSVTAVAVAAHEVAHAVQHRDGDALFLKRIELAGDMHRVEQFARLILFLIPILLVLVRSPLLAGVQIIMVVFLLSSRIVIQFFTLPVEMDASFKKALPALSSGYLQPKDIAAARHVLRAAAFTYIAAACATLLNLARIMRGR